MSEQELITGALPGPEEFKSETIGRDTDLTPTGRKRGRPPGSVSRVKLEALQTELADRITEYVAVPIGMVSPLGAAVLDYRADKTATALCRIAATSPRMRRALERFVQGSAIVDVGGTVIAVGIAISVDMHKLEPMSMLGRAAKIPQVWSVAYPDEQMWEFSQNGSSVEGRGILFEEQ